MGEIVCEIPVNSQEVIRFRLGEFKDSKFIDIRIFASEPGRNGAKAKKPAPTKRGLAVSPLLWPQFKAALDHVEVALIKQGWLDKEDLGEGR